MVGKSKGDALKKHSLHDEQLATWLSGLTITVDENPTDPPNNSFITAATSTSTIPAISKATTPLKDNNSNQANLTERQLSELMEKLTLRDGSKNIKSLNGSETASLSSTTTHRRNSYILSPGQTTPPEQENNYPPQSSLLYGSDIASLSTVSPEISLSNFHTPSLEQSNDLPFNENTLQSLHCDGIDPLLLACMKGDLEQLKKLRIRGATINENNISILLLTIKHKHISIAEYLLNNLRKCELSKIIDYKDINGNTPLMLSIKTENYALARKLIHRKADQSITNCRQEGAYSMACELQKKYPQLISPLFKTLLTSNLDRKRLKRIICDSYYNKMLKLPKTYDALLKLIGKVKIPRSKLKRKLSNKKLNLKPIKHALMLDLIHHGNNLKEAACNANCSSLKECLYFQLHQIIFLLNSRIGKQQRKYQAEQHRENVMPRMAKTVLTIKPPPPDKYIHTIKKIYLGGKFVSVDIYSSPTTTPSPYTIIYFAGTAFSASLNEFPHAIGSNLIDKIPNCQFIVFPLQEKLCPEYNLNAIKDYAWEAIQLTLIRHQNFNIDLNKIIFMSYSAGSNVHADMTIKLLQNYSFPILAQIFVAPMLSLDPKITNESPGKEWEQQVLSKIKQFPDRKVRVIPQSFVENISEICQNKQNSFFYRTHSSLSPIYDQRLPSLFCRNTWGFCGEDDVFISHLITFFSLISPESNLSPISAQDYTDGVYIIKDSKNNLCCIYKDKHHSIMWSYEKLLKDIAELIQNLPPSHQTSSASTPFPLDDHNPLHSLIRINHTESTTEVFNHAFPLPQQENQPNIISLYDKYGMNIPLIAAEAGNIKFFKCFLNANLSFPENWAKTQDLSLDLLDFAFNNHRYELLTHFLKDKSTAIKQYIDNIQPSRFLELLFSSWLQGKCYNIDKSFELLEALIYRFKLDPEDILQDFLRIEKCNALAGSQNYKEIFNCILKNFSRNIDTSRLNNIISAAAYHNRYDLVCHLSKRYEGLRLSYQSYIELIKLSYLSENNASFKHSFPIETEPLPHSCVLELLEKAKHLNNQDLLNKIVSDQILDYLDAKCFSFLFAFGSLQNIEDALNSIEIDRCKIDFLLNVINDEKYLFYEGKHNSSIFNFLLDKISKINTSFKKTKIIRGLLYVVCLHGNIEAVKQLFDYKDLTLEYSENLFYSVCQRNKYDVAKKILGKLNINRIITVQPKKCTSTLYNLCCNGNLKAVELIIEKLEYNNKDNNVLDSLIQASNYYGHSKITIVLLSKYFSWRNQNITTISSELLIQKEMQFLSNSCYHINSKEALEFFLKKTIIKRDSYLDESSLICFFYATINNLPEQLNLLLEHFFTTETIKQYDDYFKNLLVTACQNGYVKIVKILLNKNITPCIAPLWEASYHGYHEITATLLQHGYDCHINEEYFSTISDPSNLTPLMLACQNADLLTTSTLLGIPIPNHNNMLIAHIQADTNVINKDKQSALWLAMDKGATFCAELVLQANISAKTINTPCNDYTPFMLACQQGEGHLVASMIAKGADINKEVNQQSPLSLAIENRHLDVIKLLLKQDNLTLSQSQRNLLCTNFNQYPEITKQVLYHGSKNTAGTISSFSAAACYGHYETCSEDHSYLSPKRDLSTLLGAQTNTTNDSNKSKSTEKCESEKILLSILNTSFAAMKITDQNNLKPTKQLDKYSPMLGIPKPF